MKLKIKRESIWIIFSQIILFLLISEKLYNPTYFSGRYNQQVTLIICGISLAFLLLRKVSLKKSDIVSIMAIIYIVLYGFCNESIRYGLVFFSLLIWSKIPVKNINILQKVLVIEAVILSMIDLSRGYERVSGFSSGSPTLFSCALAINFTYFIFKKEREKGDYIYALICVILLIKTESSSTLILFVVLTLYKIGINILKKFGFKSLYTKMFIAIGTLFVVALLVVDLDALLRIFNRSNRDASTLTRLGLYQKFWDMFIKTPESVIFGYGGGFTQEYIQAFWGVSSHLPLHQDVLMFACEYGLFGMFIIIKFLIKRYNFNFIIIAILLLSTFHNIILAPTILLLLVITSNALNMQYGDYKTLWS
ncbi:TPA: O-antigen ligase family protein [Enterococcus faecium]|uniref:O-antigen ligase family protein n=1 Tax=Enterococcus faecium TaxID=1352 RepID=UPI0011224225|nr:O-antigen ligase family protein [Enterococcus faecium]MCU7382720.1 O-antigen ligase family protein [Enterococcus faecium]QDB89933.1 O-antigen ligase family protein [Enterococcus faecium]HAQ7747615.1 O-antigen ligase family protein [Enterococcus faecium]HCD9885501.1 O-antigen ligase family protein [Enterococcus faecium]